MARVDGVLAATVPWLLHALTGRDGRRAAQHTWRRRGERGDGTLAHVVAGFIDLGKQRRTCVRAMSSRCCYFGGFLLNGRRTPRSASRLPLDSF